MEQIRRTKVLSDRAAAALRRIPGAKRIAMMEELIQSCRDALALMIQQSNPTWSEEQVRREVAQRVARLNQ